MARAGREGGIKGTTGQRGETPPSWLRARTVNSDPESNARGQGGENKSDARGTIRLTGHRPIDFGRNAVDPKSALEVVIALGCIIATSRDSKELYSIRQKKWQAGGMSAQGSHRPE